MAHETILILGGTKEAAELAKALVSQGHNVTTSLAGRTKEPAPLEGKVRTGGFGGPEGLADWMRDNKITRLIDATHPFASQISSNAKMAANLAQVPLEVRCRKPWQQQQNDHWITVTSLDQAAAEIPAGSRVLLALGSQHLAAFEHREDVHFIIRMVDAPHAALPFAKHSVILGRPSLDWREETALLKRENITHIVCRNSGGEGAYGKIKAANSLGMPVIILEREG